MHASMCAIVCTDCMHFKFLSLLSLLYIDSEDSSSSDFEEDR